jgi:hypothetical protein
MADYKNEQVHICAFPRECAAATTIFSPSAGGDFQGAAEEFAVCLGVGTDFCKVREMKAGGDGLADYLAHFQDNLDLLITKTWVDKFDEIHREKLRARIPDLISDIEDADFKRALAEFGEILQELAWLFFGAQSGKADFIEFASRIDPQIGLFWWYSSKIQGAAEDAAFPTESLRSLLLLGICYLTDF